MNGRFSPDLAACYAATLVTLPGQVNALDRRAAGGRARAFAVRERVLYADKGEVVSAGRHRAL
jgi:hypothetical protein